jgi:hypothetical protein
MWYVFMWFVVCVCVCVCVCDVVFVSERVSHQTKEDSGRVQGCKWRALFKGSRGIR